MMPMQTSGPCASLRLQDIGEYALIERFRQLLPPPPTALVVGVGDDAALWQPTPGYLLALTCDCMVEGQHFPPFSELSEEEIRSVGHRAAHINLSDVAAMAAKPRFALVSLALPGVMLVQTVEQFYIGLVSAFTSEQVTIVGGNITATTGPFHASISLGGEVLPGQAVLRTGSRPGDWIGVTGYPGHAAAGLHCWLHPEQTPWYSGSFETRIQTRQHPHIQPLLQAYWRPTARLQEAAILAPYLHALTDISDGLLLDLANLLQPCGLGAILQDAALPYSPAIRDLSRHLHRPPQAWMFSPSDDYELIFTAPPEHVPTIQQRWSQNTQTPLHWIGQVTQNPTFMLEQENQHVPLAPEGWQHFCEKSSGG